MQHDREDTTFSNGKEGRTPFETVPSDAWNDTIEYSGTSPSYGVREQAQAYAPQEYVPEEYRSGMSSQWEKVTSLPPRRRSQRGWLAVIAITVVLFFVIGSGMTMWMMPREMQFIKGPHPIVKELRNAHLFENPKYASIAQDEIANALHLTPQQITQQLREGKRMTDIAAAQGVSASDLQNIELKAIAHFLDAVTKSGDIDQQDANQWMKQLQAEPQVLDRVTVTLFFVGSDRP